MIPDFYKMQISPIFNLVAHCVMIKYILSINQYIEHGTVCSKVKISINYNCIVFMACKIKFFFSAIIKIDYQCHSKNCYIFEMKNVLTLAQNKQLTFKQRTNQREI